MTEDSFREGRIIKEKCVEPEDFIRKYKDTDDEEIKGIVNTIMEAYFCRVDETISRFQMFYDIFLYDPDERSDQYKFCFVSDFFKLREDVFNDWLELSIDYAYSKSKDGYWEFVDFTIEDLWNKNDTLKQMPSLEEIIESDIVTDNLRNYTEAVLKIWEKLPQI